MTQLLGGTHFMDKKFLKRICLSRVLRPKPGYRMADIRRPESAISGQVFQEGVAKKEKNHLTGFCLYSSQKQCMYICISYVYVNVQHVGGTDVLRK